MKNFEKLEEMKKRELTKEQLIKAWENAKKERAKINESKKEMTI